jgi:hypothetical protein
LLSTSTSPLALARHPHQSSRTAIAVSHPSGVAPDLVSALTGSRQVKLYASRRCRRTGILKGILPHHCAELGSSGGVIDSCGPTWALVCVRQRART